jgi:peptide/nickel transport system ATP-binding protein
MHSDKSKPDILLRLSGLSISFDGRKASEDISLQLQQGKCLGIVGESGSGKSICALAIIGLLPPNAIIESGSIIFNQGNSETELLKLEEKRMQRIRGKDISMIFQEPMTSLNPVKRCGHQVEEVIRLHLGLRGKKAKDAVLSLFKEVRLPDPESAYQSFPHQLSGGQRQRVMIAQAIACKPRLLIADEPTTALDVTVQKTIVELLRDLQQKHGMSMIFITHDLGLVSQIADRIAVMHKGKLVEEGDAATVLRSPGQAYTRGLLACRPGLSTSDKRLPTLADFTEGVTGGTTFQEKPPIELNPIDYQESPLLELRNLRVSYPQKQNFLGRVAAWYHAVDEVTLDVWKGETLGLVGESGCGKTSLGRALLRLIPSSAGSIVFDGLDIGALQAKQMKALRKRMQIIFQDPYSSLNPRIRVGDAITEVMQVHSLHGGHQSRKDAAKDLMMKVGLDPDSFRRYPHEFSGGQRQRICIARALAVEPEFIICDESVSALDVSVQAQVLNLLRDLKEDFGLTYIFISHDLSVVKYMSDRIAVMRKGKIIEIQESETLYKSPGQDYTRTLLEAIPRLIV